MLKLVGQFYHPETNLPVLALYDVEQMTLSFVITDDEFAPHLKDKFNYTQKWCDKYIFKGILTTKSAKLKINEVLSNFPKNERRVSMNKCIICGKHMYLGTSLVSLDEKHKAHLTCFFEKVPNGLQGQSRTQFLDNLAKKLVDDYKKTL